MPTTTAHSPETLERLTAAGLDPARLPRHVAIIMDGNGRWAEQRGLPRVEGHRRGSESVRTTVEECCRLGIGQLTLYCLSIENWKRPQAELDFLMALLEQYLIQERPLIMEQDIRFTMIGRRDGLPARVLHELDESTRLSRHNRGTVLCLAINYGGRTELVDETVLGDALYTAGMADPDLLIRTANEMRVSNFLLWQISYSELWVTEQCWPDFGRETMHQALRDYAHRERRFGGLK
jgi:undecaprenyl diphosphate synthase